MKKCERCADLAISGNRIARLLRIGQESDKVNIVQMVSNHPLDIHCHQLLADKTAVHKATVG